jgi:hypothetical protein
MIHRIWKLSEPGEDNLGLAVAPEGLVLGRTPLLERRDASFIVRERHEIQRLLTRAHRMEPAIDRLMSGLATVASALNAKDPCLAHIAAVHLRIPDLPNQIARDEMEAEDVFIKSGGRTSALRRHEVRKASADDPKHPGWPAGTPGDLAANFVRRMARKLTSRRQSKIALRDVSCV